MLFCFILSTSSSSAESNIKFISLVNKILKQSAKLKDNQGLSFSLEGSAFVAGTGLTLDVVNIRGEVALFCSASVSARIQTDAALTASASYFQTRGCQTPDQYEGTFLSVMASGGVDFYASASAMGGLSFGVDTVLLADTIRKRIIEEPEKIHQLLKEILNLQYCNINASTTAFLDSLLQSILKGLDENLPQRASPVLRAEIQNLKKNFSVSHADLENSRKPGTCGMSFDSEELYSLGQKYFELGRESWIEDHNIASLLPNKDQLALLYEDFLDPELYPTLRPLILEILRRDFMGCDSLHLGLGASLASGSAIAASFAGAISNYKKIGPSIPVRKVREFVIDRYVQEDGFDNVIHDSQDTFYKVCQAGKNAGQCVWRASCRFAENPSIAIGAIKNQYHNFCNTMSMLKEKFLNGVKECTYENYKEILVPPFEVLTGRGHDE